MSGLYSIGLFSKTRRVPIIVYHSVDESGSCISITRFMFKRQMEMIKENG